MAEKKEQAKQLDSVTDRVEETEVDAVRAQQAMSALSSKNDDTANNSDQVVLSKDDIDLIVSELEVTEETAQRTLREVAGDLKEGETLVLAALRKLITS